MRLSWRDPSFAPCDDAVVIIDAIAGSALFGFGMRALRIQHEFDRRLRIADEMGEHFLGLAPWTSAVVFAVQQQGGRARVRKCLQHGDLVPTIAVFGGFAVHQPRGDVMAGVAGAEMRFEVRDRRAHDRGAEQVAVADGPRGQEAAIGFSGASDAVVAQPF